MLSGIDLPIDKCTIDTAVEAFHLYLLKIRIDWTKLAKDTSLVHQLVPLSGPLWDTSFICCLGLSSRETSRFKRQAYYCVSPAWRWTLAFLPWSRETSMPLRKESHSCALIHVKTVSCCIERTTIQVS